MCHVLLTLPLMALPVFWMLPPSIALPIYGTVAGVSLVVYWYALQAMKRPVATGIEGMIGELGTVVEMNERELLVRIHNELWRATGHGVAVHAGDTVEVVGYELRMLRVRRINPLQRFLPGDANANTPPGLDPGAQPKGRS